MQKIKFLFTFVVAFFLPFTALGAVEISDGSVIGLYHMEGTADSSGNGRNLTLTGSPTLGACVLGNCYTFNGTSQYATSSNNLFPWGTANYGISLLAKNNSDTQFCFLASQTTGSGDGGLDLCYGYSAGNMQNCKVGVTGGCQEGAWTSDNNWHNWTFEGNGSGMTIYRDNTQIATNVNTSALINSSNPVGFAARHIGSVDTLFNGQLDEVVVLNRAFSNAERTALYNSGSFAEVCVTVGCGSSGGSSGSTSTAVIGNSQGINLLDLGIDLFAIVLLLLGGTTGYKLANRKTA